jgi:hypothetical protein
MIFEDRSIVLPQYPEHFLDSAEYSSIASLCHTRNLWPSTFLQAWIHTTLWELASQDIYDKTYGYISVSFFLAEVSTMEHTLFNSELDFSINVDRLLTSLAKTDY